MDGQLPKTGDLTVCRHCGEFLAFTEGGGLRLLRPGEWESLQPSDRRTLEDVRRVFESVSLIKFRTRPH